MMGFSIHNLYSIHYFLYFELLRCSKEILYVQNQIHSNQIFHP